MKRLFSVVVALTTMLCGIFAQGTKKVWQDAFFAEVDYNFALNTNNFIDKGYYNQRPHSFSVSGGYQWFIIKGLYVQPSVLLFFGQEKHGRGPLDGGYAKEVTFTFKEYGVGVNALAGYSFPIKSTNSLNIFTGPKATYAFRFDEEYDSAIQHNCHHKRMMWYWSLGAQFNLFNHYYAKASIDFGLVKQNFYYSQTKFNRLEFGIGYRF